MQRARVAVGRVGPGMFCSFVPPIQKMPEYGHADETAAEGIRDGIEQKPESLSPQSAASAKTG